MGRQRVQAHRHIEDCCEEALCDFSAMSVLWALRLCRPCCGSFSCRACRRFSFCFISQEDVARPKRWALPRRRPAARGAGLQPRRGGPRHKAISATSALRRARGTMNLMMGSRHIMLFSAGPVNPLIPEHDFGATLHAATPCEAYRVGLYDILLATHCVRAKWFEKLLEEVQVKVRLKLQGARSIQTMRLKKSRTEVSLNPLKKEEEGDKDRAMGMDFVAQAPRA
eukprot:s2591_g2.t2